MIFFLIGGWLVFVSREVMIADQHGRDAWRKPVVLWGGTQSEREPQEDAPPRQDAGDEA